MSKYSIKRFTKLLTACLLLMVFLLGGKTGSDNLCGVYLGQKPPGNIPVVFAKGIVSTEKNEHSPAIFSKDGNELFWSYYDKGEHVIMYMQQKDGVWTKPSKFVYGAKFKDGNPFFSSDWSKIIFHSGRRGDRKDGSMNIDFWYIDKTVGKWNKAKMIAFPPNDDQWQLYGCQAASGNFYYTSKTVEKSRNFLLYFSKFNGKTWEKGEPMAEMFNKSTVNWTPYVSPDESYIIFSSDRAGTGESYDECDLYISFKDSNGKWKEPVNMGDKINTDKIERFPWVSPDEKYLFFVRGFGDVYWVSTDIIDQLKKSPL